MEELQKALKEIEELKKERDELREALDIILKMITPSDSGIIFQTEQ